VDQSFPTFSTKSAKSRHRQGPSLRFLIQSGFPRGNVSDLSGGSGASDEINRTRNSSPIFSSSVSYQSTRLSPEGSGALSIPPNAQDIPGIGPAEAAAIEEAFGSFPTQFKVNDKTPVLLSPAVAIFSSFLQTSKQSTRFPFRTDV
jgi:hypothetical protein